MEREYDETEAPRPATPFGIPKGVLTGFYFVVCAVTGCAAMASDPMQQLLKLNGAFSEIAPLKDRDNAIAGVIGLGVSCSVIAGILVGPLMDLLGPKITALLGMCLHALGFTLLFLVRVSLLHYVGAACLGLAFQCVFNAHIGVAALFKNNPTLVVTIIGSAPDVGLFIPPMLLNRALGALEPGPESVRRIVITYMLFAFVPAAILTAFLVPNSPFQENHSVEIAKNEEESRPLFDEEAAEQVKKPAHIKYTDMTAVQQLATPDLWVFAVYIAFAFIRKKHYALFVRPILLEHGQSVENGEAIANRIADGYNNLVPYGFIPAVLWGAVVDKFGLISSLFMSNSMGFAFAALSCISLLWLQWGTVFIFILYQSYVYAQILSFCASFYGFATLPTLQGLLSAIAGVLSMVQDFFWPAFIKSVLGGHRNANILVTSLSACAFLPIVFLAIRQRKRNKKEDLHVANVAITANAPVFNRQSLSAMDADNRRAGSRLSSSRAH